MTFCIYVVNKDAPGRGPGPLVPVVGEDDKPATITPKKRELRRVLRKRAIEENPGLQQMAADKGGVRLVLVDKAEIDAKAIKGSMTFEID